MFLLNLFGYNFLLVKPFTLILNCISEMDLETIFQDGTKGFITLEATVDTGFEAVALDECKEVFGKETPVITSRGRIFFVVNKTNFQKVSSGVLYYFLF